MDAVGRLPHPSFTPERSGLPACMISDTSSSLLDVCMPQTVQTHQPSRDSSHHRLSSGNNWLFDEQHAVGRGFSINTSQDYSPARISHTDITPSGGGSRSRTTKKVPKTSETPSRFSRLWSRFWNPPESVVDSLAYNSGEFGLRSDEYNQLIDEAEGLFDVTSRSSEARRQGFAQRRQTSRDMVTGGKAKSEPPA
ncbi:hypothetical protein ACOMHN_010535 [Nucella lapillus]